MKGLDTRWWLAAAASAALAAVGSTASCIRRGRTSTFTGKSGPRSRQHGPLWRTFLTGQRTLLRELGHAFV